MVLNQSHFPDRKFPKIVLNLGVEPFDAMKPYFGKVRL